MWHGRPRPWTALRAATMGETPLQQHGQDARATSGRRAVQKTEMRQRIASPSMTSRRGRLSVHLHTTECPPPSTIFRPASVAAIAAICWSSFRRAMMCRKSLSWSMTGSVAWSSRATAHASRSIRSADSARSTSDGRRSAASSIVANRSAGGRSLVGAARLPRPEHKATSALKCVAARRLGTESRSRYPLRSLIQ